MLSSQALETGIGLTVLFFVVATAASTVVEVISRWLGKRAQNLEDAIVAMFGADDAADDGAGGRSASGQPGRLGPDVETVMNQFQQTSVYRAARAAAGRGLFWKLPRKSKKPSYLSARSFADAVTEMLVERDATTTSGGATDDPLSGLPENLQRRLRGIVREAGDDLTTIKAGLERWFDETMEHVEGAYKRWATLVLFFVGLGITVAGNISTIDVAEHLWQDPVTRQAVVAAADKVKAEDIGSVAEATDELTQLQLPIGYRSCPADDSVTCTEFSWTSFDPSTWAVTFAGWLLTSVLVMLGGPFWFDLLNRLVSLRSTGSKPAPAPADPASATSARRRLEGVAPAAPDRRRRSGRGRRAARRPAKPEAVGHVLARALTTGPSAHPGRSR